MLVVVVFLPLSFLQGMQFATQTPTRLSLLSQFDHMTKAWHAEGREDKETKQDA